MCVSEPGAAEGYAVEVISCCGTAATWMCHNVFVTKDANEIKLYSFTVNHRGRLKAKDGGMCQAGFILMNIRDCMNHNTSGVIYRSIYF